MLQIGMAGFEPACPWVSGRDSLTTITRWHRIELTSHRLIRSASPSTPHAEVLGRSIPVHSRPRVVLEHYDTRQSTIQTPYLSSIICPTVSQYFAIVINKYFRLARRAICSEIAPCFVVRSVSHCVASIQRTKASTGALCCPESEVFSYSRSQFSRIDRRIPEDGMINRTDLADQWSSSGHLFLFDFGVSSLIASDIYRATLAIDSWFHIVGLLAPQSVDHRDLIPGGTAPAQPHNSQLQSVRSNPVK